MRDLLRNREALGGILLLAFGAWVSWHVLGTMPIGTPGRMGPGFLPLSLGVLLVLFGLIQIGGALAAAEAAAIPAADWRPLAAVLGSMVVFGLLIRSTGLVPAIAASVLVASLGGSRLHPISLIATMVLLPLAVWLMLVVGLGLPLTLIRSPL